MSSKFIKLSQAVFSEPYDIEIFWVKSSHTNPTHMKWDETEFIFIPIQQDGWIIYSFLYEGFYSELKISSWKYLEM